jgi:hypothetical protein
MKKLESMVGCCIACLVFSHDAIAQFIKFNDIQNSIQAAAALHSSEDKVLGTAPTVTVWKLTVFSTSTITIWAVLSFCMIGCIAMSRWAVRCSGLIIRQLLLTVPAIPLILW